MFSTKTYTLCTAILLMLLMSCQSIDSKNINQASDLDNSADEGEKYAQLEFVEDFYDFGSIKQGEIVSYTFKLTNTGNIPLIIKKIVPECGCTQSKVSSDIIKPHEVVSFEVIFDSSGWRGLQYKSVTLHTNGKNKSKSLTIKANVVT